MRRFSASVTLLGFLLAGALKAGADESHDLVKVTNTRDDGAFRFQAIAGARGKLLGFRYQIFPGGTFSDFFTVDKVLTPDGATIVEETDGSLKVKALILKSTHLDLQSGGPLTVEFVKNALLGTYGTLKMVLQRDRDFHWRLYDASGSHSLKELRVVVGKLGMKDIYPIGDDLIYADALP